MRCRDATAGTLYIWSMDNHDSGRSLSRYASDLPQHRNTAAKMLAIYLSTLSGTLFLLQGQEIGMANAPDTWTIDDYIDVEGKNYYNSVRQKRGPDADMSYVMREMRLKARNHGRLPMQWTPEEDGGFTKAPRSWMRVNDDFKDWNVKQQVNNKNRVLNFWRQALDLRWNEKDVFIYGEFTMVEGYENSEEVFVYTMTSFDGKTALTLLNFSDQPQYLDLKGFSGWKRLYRESSENIRPPGIQLKSYEGAVYSGW